MTTVVSKFLNFPLLVLQGIYDCSCFWSMSAPGKVLKGICRYWTLPTVIIFLSFLCWCLREAITTVDGQDPAPLRNHEKPLFVGICGGIESFQGFLGGAKWILSALLHLLFITSRGLSSNLAPRSVLIAQRPCGPSPLAFSRAEGPMELNKTALAGPKVNGFQALINWTMIPCLQNWSET